MLFYFAPLDDHGGLLTWLFGAGVGTNVGAWVVCGALGFAFGTWLGKRAFDRVQKARRPPPGARQPPSRASPRPTSRRREQLMAISTKPWGQFDASDYKTPRAYAAACLINLNTGAPADWTKADCKLPVYEPNGALNVHGMAAAAAALAGGRGGVDAPADAKRAAARKLVGLYRSASMTPPQDLKALAGGDGGMNAAIRGKAS
jgi:hypothetical protein